MIDELARITGVVVRAADAAFIREVQRLPLGQKRTSANKAFTHVADREVFKGPYPYQSLKLINNLRYPYLIEQMEDALGLPDERRGVYRWHGLLSCAGGSECSYYFVGVNVDRPGRMRIRRFSTRVDADCEAVERETLVRRVCECEKVKERGRFVRHPGLDEAVALASLQHLYFRYLLNLGDSGTHNILVREDRANGGQVIAGNDFDEQRSGKEPRTVLGCLFRKDDGYLQAVYGTYLPRLVLLDGLDAAVTAALERVNTLCQAWLDTLPAARQRQLASAAVVRVPDILDRNERLRAWLECAPLPAVASAS
jgi:hypothetical protein